MQDDLNQSSPAGRTNDSALRFERISLADLPEGIERLARRCGLTFCKSTDMYGAFVGPRMQGFTGLLFYRQKVIFKNHFVLPEFRWQGIFQQMLTWSIDRAVERGIEVGEACCTAASLPEYLRRGFVVMQRFKSCTKVRHECLSLAQR